MFGLNVRYPLLMALLVAFADALPIIGSGTIIIPWAIISSVQGDINLAICLIVLYIYNDCKTTTRTKSSRKSNWNTPNIYFACNVHRI